MKILGLAVAALCLTLCTGTAHARHAKKSQTSAPAGLTYAEEGYLFSGYIAGLSYLPCPTPVVAPITDWHRPHDWYFRCCPYYKYGPGHHHHRRSHH